MKFLYRYHVGKGRVSEYLKYFRQLSGCEQHYPLILLYDNEQERKKPLKQFLNEEVHATEVQKGELKSHLYLHLVSDSKLYIVTNPLVDSLAQRFI